MSLWAPSCHAPRTGKFQSRQERLTQEESDTVVFSHNCRIGKSCPLQFAVKLQTLKCFLNLEEVARSSYNRMLITQFLVIRIA